MEQQIGSGLKVSLSRPPAQDETSIGFDIGSGKVRKEPYEDGVVTLSTGMRFSSIIRVFRTEDKGRHLDVTVRDPAFVRALAAATTVSVSHPDLGSFALSLQKLAPAVAALRSCEDQRMASWGIDVPAYWALASRPRPANDFYSLFTPDNYPWIAIISYMQRNVIAKLDVSSDGTVASCTAPGNFAFPQFVDSVCKVFKKGARFEPARDANGKAAPAPYVVIVSFRMR